MQKLKNFWAEVNQSQTKRIKNRAMVYSSSQEYLVQLIAGKLESNGIHSVILNLKDSAYNNFGSVELYVYTKDVIRAKYIINQTEEE